MNNMMQPYKLTLMLPVLLSLLARHVQGRPTPMEPNRHPYSEPSDILWWPSALDATLNTPLSQRQSQFLNPPALNMVPASFAPAHALTYPGNIHLDQVSNQYGAGEGSHSFAQSTEFLKSPIPFNLHWPTSSERDTQSGVSSYGDSSHASEVSRKPTSDIHHGYSHILHEPTIDLHLPELPSTSFTYDHLSPLEADWALGDGANSHFKDRSLLQSPSLNDEISQHELEYPLVRPVTEAHKPQSINDDKLNTGSLTSAAKPSEGVGTYTRKGQSIWIQASKFLQHHPQLVEVRNDDSKNEQIPMTSVEMSPEAQELKATINRQLFSNKLAWKAKGDAMITYQHRDDALRRFVSRISSREAMYVSRDMIDSHPGRFKGSIAVAAHNSFQKGNVMFEAESGGRRILFSFWAPSHDERLKRLQFVGSAALNMDDANIVLKNAQSPLEIRTSHAAVQVVDGPLAPLMRVMAPRLRTTSTFQTFLSSKDWLNNSPLLERVKVNGLYPPTAISSALVSRRHRKASELKDLVNAILFGGKIVWQSKPGEVMDTHTVNANSIFRHHKESSFMYLTKTGLEPLIGHKIVFIPYEIPGPRARLFDANLKGHPHTFTVWASRDDHGGTDALRFDYVGGGAVHINEAERALQHAQSLLQELSREAGHEA